MDLKLVANKFVAAKESRLNTFGLLSSITFYHYYLFKMLNNYKNFAVSVSSTAHSSATVALALFFAFRA